PGAATADSTALPADRPRDLRRFAQARRHVTEARDLDLRARFPGASVAMEDLEDDHGPVHHLAADLTLEVAGLRGRNLVIDEDDVGAARVRIGRRLCGFLGLGLVVLRCAGFSVGPGLVLRVIELTLVA